VASQCNIDRGICYVWRVSGLSLVSEGNEPTFWKASNIDHVTMIYRKVVYSAELKLQGVPLATEPGISLIILPLMRILQRLQPQATDTFLFISHTTNVLLFKFRCNIFIGVRIIKEMPGSVVSGTHCSDACISYCSLHTTHSSSGYNDNLMSVVGKRHWW